MALPAPNAKMPTISLPVGTAVYPHLHRPDTRFSDPPGEYKTSVHYTGDAVKEVKAILKEHLARSKEFFVEGEGKADEPRRPWSIPTDEDDNEIPGILVKFKMMAGGVNKKGEQWSQSPAIFDATGTPVKPGLRIGGGSKIRVAFQPYLYHGFGKYGVSCWMQAVQVIELETWTEKNAESFGFDQEEDGEGFNATEASDNYFAGDDEAEDEFVQDDEDVDEEDFEGADF